MIVDAAVDGAGLGDRGDDRGRPERDRGPGQAGADAVGARDRDRRLPQRRRGRRPARGPAPARARDGRGEGPDDRLRGHPSVRAVGGPADRRARPLPRDRRRACASSPARSCCSACTCTSASTTPRRRSTSPTGCACTCRSCSRCRPTRRSGAASPTGLMSTPHARSSACCRASASRRASRAGATTRRASSSWSRPARSPDYTFLWWDVRPHPNLGTVEVRSCDAQTRLEHTIALAALIQAMCKELAEHYEAGLRARHLSRASCSRRTSGWPRATASTAS